MEIHRKPREDHSVENGGQGAMSQGARPIETSRPVERPPRGQSTSHVFAGEAVSVNSTQWITISREQYEILRNERNYFRNEVNRLVNQAISSNVQDMERLDDEYFLREIESLRYYIFSFATNHFRNATRRKIHLDLRGEGWWDIGNLTKCNQAERYFASDAHRPSLIQSYVWHLLLGAALDLDTVLWVPDDLRSSWGTIARAVLKTSDLSSGSSPEANSAQRNQIFQRYNTWRSTFARLTHIVEAEFEHTDGFAKALKHLLSSLERYSSSTKEGLKSSLTDILIRAIKLDHEIYCQKANLRWFTHVDLNKPNRSDPNIHALYAETRNPMPVIYGNLPSAQLVVAPALVRLGTIDGMQDNTETVIVKADIS